MATDGYAEYLLFRGRLFSLFRPARDANRRYAKGETHLSQPPTLGAQHAREQTVQRADVDVVFRKWTQTSHPHQHSPKQNRRKKSNVRVRRALNRQAGSAQSFFQLSQSVTATVMADVILHPPQKHELRHEQQPSPAEPQHAKHFAQARNIIVDMLYDIKGGYQIKLSVFVRQFLSGPLPDFTQAARATKVERFRRN